MTTLTPEARETLNNARQRIDTALKNYGSEMGMSMEPSPSLAYRGRPSTSRRPRKRSLYAPSFPASTRATSPSRLMRTG